MTHTCVEKYIRIYRYVPTLLLRPTLRHGAKYAHWIVATHASSSTFSLSLPHTGVIPMCAGSYSSREWCFRRSVVFLRKNWFRRRVRFRSTCVRHVYGFKCGDPRYGNGTYHAAISSLCSWIRFGLVNRMTMLKSRYAVPVACSTSSVLFHVCTTCYALSNMSAREWNRSSLNLNRYFYTWNWNRYHG